jgi:hypothetical protein
MAIALSVTTEAILQKGTIVPSLIVEIEGFDFLFGTVRVVKQAKIGDFIIGDGTKIGGGVVDETSKDWVSFTGTTNNITQDINIDRADGNSITSFKIQFIDKNESATRLFSPSFQVDDILGKEAKVHFMPVGGVFPKDSNAIFLGIIDNVEFGAGNVSINIAHPNQLNRQDLLPKFTSKLSAAINNSTTTIPLEAITGLLEDQDALTSYVKVDDEIIKVGSISGLNLINCVRGQLNTLAASHDDESDVESFYRLQGFPTDLALKIMTSGLGEFGEENAKRFNLIDSLTTVQNAIFFPIFNIADELGLTIGDLVSCSGATNGANNFTDRVIENISQSDSGSYIIVDGADLVDEIDSSALVTFKSQYDVLNFGCAIKPYHIDIPQFQSIKQYFSAAFIEYDFYIKDTINAKEFLDAEVYFPSAIYSIPRKGKISINYSAPPLATQDVKTLSSDNIKDPEKIRIKRSINQKFYNAVVFKYEQDSLEDKFLKGLVTQSADSTNRIKVGNKALTIETKGSRNNAETNTAFETISRRLLDRYRYGAEYFECDVNFATGYAIDIGDPVIVDGASVKLSDSKTGDRDFIPRVMECTNKSINLKTGAVSIELTDTIYGGDERYGVISPSSRLASGSTTTILKIKESVWSESLSYEIGKWNDYIFEDVCVRSVDFSYYEITRILSVNRNNFTINVNALPSAPPENYIIETAQYLDGAKQMRLFKSQHCYFSPIVSVTGGDTTGPEVGAGDVAKFWVGSKIQIHLPDYSENFETFTNEITGNKILTRDVIPFTPTSSHKISMIGFSGDNGKHYAWF